ncbi:MAG: hypothetical protein RIF32_02625 [Leptospirales bacterium]|jgi:hypothetical protein
MTALELCSEIFARLREFNANEKNSFRLMTSDDIYRQHMSDLVTSAEQLDGYIEALSEAHYLFRLKIVEPDEHRKSSGIYAYLVAELPLIGKLRGWADGYLEGLYEQQFYRRKQAMPILRELIPESRRFNNTELGRGLNVASMLLQYEKLIVEAFGEFTDGWKWKTLKSSLLSSALASDEEIAAFEALGPDPQKRFGSDPKAAAATLNPMEAGAESFDTVDADAPEDSADDVAEAPLAQFDGPFDANSDELAAEEFPADPRRRAVDLTELDELQAMDLSGNWGRVVKKYGVIFLVRIHLRKYEFDILRALIRGGRISREDDLRYLRDSLRKMQGRLDSDPPLKSFVKEMAELRRLAQVRLNRIYEVKRRLQPDQVYAGIRGGG